MTDKFEKNVAVDGPVVNEGERGSSTFSPGPGTPVGPLEVGQRWTVARKREAALRLLRGEPVELLSRELGVEIFRLKAWRDNALAGIDASLKERKGDLVKGGTGYRHEADRGVDHAGGTAGGQKGDVRPSCAAAVDADTLKLVTASSSTTAPITPPTCATCSRATIRSAPRRAALTQRVCSNNVLVDASA